MDETGFNDGMEHASYFFFSVCVFLLSLYFSGSVNTYLQSSAPLIFRHYVQKEKKKDTFSNVLCFFFFF